MDFVIFCISLHSLYMCDLVPRFVLIVSCIYDISHLILYYILLKIFDD